MTANRPAPPGMDVAIPTHNGDVVTAPRAATWTTRARANRTAAEAWTFEVAGKPAGTWRREGRQEVWTGALAATAEMDPAAPAGARPGPSRLLLATGHQPELFHPGVWIKALLIEGICRTEGVGGLNVVVDSDLPDGPRIPVPELRGGRWHKSWLHIPGMRSGLPWESQAPLSPDQWRGLLQEVERRMGAGPGTAASEAREACRRFGEVVARSEPVRAARSLAESLSRARRAWQAQDGQPLLLEIPVSGLSRTTAFFRFVAEMLCRLDSFWQAYNESLQVFRETRGIRSQAHPAPNLRRRDTLWETPFWCIHPSGERRGLFVNGRPGRWLLQSKDSDLLELPADPVVAAVRLAETFGAPDSEFTLRPRALTLTMFLRMLACDLFVHGLGGVHYEGVGDGVLRRFWGVDPPEYAAASATAHVDLGVALPRGDDSQVLVRRLRDTTWNPQRFVSRMEGEAGELEALARRKEALVKALRPLPRGQRAGLTREIRRINQELGLHLARFRAGLGTRLEKARLDHEERRALAARDYPFFLFDVARVRGLAGGSPAAEAGRGITGDPGGLQTLVKPLPGGTP